MDVQNYIQEKIEQVQTIIDIMKSKMKVVISLSTLLRKDKLLDILKPSEMKILRELRYRYKNIRETDNTDDFMEPFNGEMDEELSYLVEVLNSNPEVHKLINDHLQNQESLKDYIHAIDQYKHFIGEQMRMTMKMSINRKNKLNNSTMNFRSNEIELEMLKSRLKEQKSHYEKCIQQLQREIELCESNLEHKKLTHHSELEKIINSSEQEMMYVSKYMKYQTDDLDNQIQDENKKYEHSVKVNLTKEIELQTFRFVAEDKLLSAIASYDKDIGQKQEFKENLIYELTDLEKNYEAVKEKFHQQEAQYLELKQEKELIILKMFTERLENFEKNRAARKIQNYWRAYRERIALRKKRRSRRK